ncbi:MAG: hypothetical protein TE42_08975 [Candidatus Synechococcus spongiarum SP3]|uniref:Uncharacterized protein n=1 Tax=Candidatus Synechococcus spongiarum SP3 TaxID=1604020 RepID=A0A0G2HJH6_9SYNE|nr:MAG: hypothetical protein TE42_08975 [Candidatus Synechococcus spongiarum SP3]
MTTQPPNRCQQAALLFAGVSCSLLALGSWSPDASAHPHAPGAATVPHTHGVTTLPQSTDRSADPALWLAGLSCAMLAVPASRRWRSQVRSQG